VRDLPEGSHLLLVAKEEREKSGGNPGGYGEGKSTPDRPLQIH